MFLINGGNYTMIKKQYMLWLEKATKDPDLIKELNSIKNNDDAINDAFYKNLEFGTAGLRGIIGAGTNRMNVYTVGKASQGLAEYVNSINENAKIAIAYDSRIKSMEFAKVAAEIFAANGIKVYIYKELMPTPMLSYAVRYLKCDAGIVITASHNPAKYNGYKAYASDGCQLGPDAAEYVLSIMNNIDEFKDIKSIDFDEGIKTGIIEYIGDNVINSYLDEVEKCRVSPKLDISNLKVIYTPLYGTGNKPVRNILKRIGVKDVTMVTEQESPDGNFPTVPYPNPEIRQAFELAIDLSKTIEADILLATDPDADRVGIAVNDNGEFKLFSGNDVGALLLNYILERRTENGTLPENPVVVKTIVSTEICRKIADHYSCELKDVLTGFKYIGEQILKLEQKGQEKRYVFGFEESYGYLAGSYVRDKDAVVASMLICEMTAYYKSLGKTLVDVLIDLYKKFGYYYCAQKSFSCEGQSGMIKISEIMKTLRNTTPVKIHDSKVIAVNDYLTSLSTNILEGKSEIIDLPKSNVISFSLENGSTLIVRPSGTEPKIKIYVNAVGKTADEAEKTRSAILRDATDLLGF